MDVGLVLVTCKVDRFMSLSRASVLPICCIKTGLFAFKISCSQVWNGRTDGQPENIMLPPASVAWPTAGTKSDPTRKYRNCFLLNILNIFLIIIGYMSTCHAELGATELYVNIVLTKPSSFSIFDVEV